MTTPVVFPYQTVPGPVPILRPLVPIVLARGSRSLSELGLVDSGADACVLPYSMGLRLSLDWNTQPALPSPGGVVGNTPGRGAMLEATIQPFPPVRLGFLWLQRDDLPLILGQANFFMEFDVCFFRARGVFQLQPAATP